MAKYTIKRLLQSLLTILLVGTAAFLLLRVHPASRYFTEEQLSELSQAQQEEQLRTAGLLDPLPVQLLRFYGGLFRLDFGVSRNLEAGTPARALLAPRLGISMVLFAFLLAAFALTGLLMGVGRTLFKSRVLGRIGTFCMALGRVAPGMVLSSLLLVCGYRVLKLPAVYSAERPGWSGVLPVVCLLLISAADYALWSRRQPPVEDGRWLAHSRGMDQRKFLLRCGLRTAAVSLLRYFPQWLLLVAGGSLLVENIFYVPGLGALTVVALATRDVDVALACVLLYAVLIALGTFLGDILRQLLDPQTRPVEKEEPADE